MIKDVYLHPLLKKSKFFGRRLKLKIFSGFFAENFASIIKPLTFALRLKRSVLWRVEKRGLEKAEEAGKEAEKAGLRGRKKLLKKIWPNEKQTVALHSQKTGRRDQKGSLLGLKRSTISNGVRAFEDKI